MLPLTTLLRTLGNDGAVANARTVLEHQQRETWLVQGLSRRLEDTKQPVSPAASAA